jgi:hypothetical protein
MTMLPRLLVCVLVVGAAAPVHGAPVTQDTSLAVKCRAASFARRPPGQMAKTLRDMQIQRCIKNNGMLVD